MCRLDRHEFDHGRVLLLKGLAGIATGVLTLLWLSVTAQALAHLIAAWAILTGAFEVVARDARTRRRAYEMINRVGLKAGQLIRRIQEDHTMQKLRYLTILLILTTLLVASGGPSPSAMASPGAVAPNLHSAASFVGLAHETFTNTGAGVFVGDVGTSPGISVTGFPPGSVRNGAIHINDGVAAQAMSDATTAYTALAGQACNVDLTGKDLGGMTLTPGVYCFDTSAQLTGDLVLDALGNPLAVWVFKVGSTLTTAPDSSVASSVAMINGGQALNVFWQVGSSATLDTGTRFSGNILAHASVTLNNRASLVGRAFGLTGAVTMDTTDAPAPITNTPLFEFCYLPLIMR